MTIPNVSNVVPQIVSALATQSGVPAPDVAFDSVLNTQMAQAPNGAQLHANAGNLAALSPLVPPLDVLTKRGETLVAQLLDEDDISLDADTNLESIDPLDQGFDFDAAFNTEPDLDPLETSRLAVTPFQFFIDKSVDLFRKVSGMEWRADRLMEEYAKGNISIEEMTIVKAETGVAISFAVTLLTQVTAAFNELKNMQI